MPTHDLSSNILNVTSEHGEDGVIRKIFEIIGEESKWCVDLGALAIGARSESLALTAGRGLS